MTKGGTLKSVGGWEGCHTFNENSVGERRGGTEKGESGGRDGCDALHENSVGGRMGRERERSQKR